MAYSSWDASQSPVAPKPTAQPYQNFQQMQQQGYARPPVPQTAPTNYAPPQPAAPRPATAASDTRYPQQPSGMQPTQPQQAPSGTAVQRYQTPQMPVEYAQPPQQGGGYQQGPGPQTVYAPGYQPPQGGGGMQPMPPPQTYPAPGQGQGGNIEQGLYGQYGQSGQFGSQSPLLGQAQQFAGNWMQNPSAYNAPQVQQTFEMLNRQLGQGFDVQRQQLQEQMARQGLSSSTVYGGRLGDLATNQANAQRDLATQLATQAAQGYGQDRSAALAGALGAQGQGFGQQQQSLQNLLGYGQQGFQNQLQTAQFNQQQDYQQQQLLAMLLGQLGGTTGTGAG